MTRFNPKNRRILVTGASSGLGREIASQLAADHGAKVVATARRRERLEELASHVQPRAPHEIEVLPGDLGSIDGAQEVYRRACESDKLDALVLNAGITFYGRDHEQTPAAFETMLATNVTANVVLTRAFVAECLASNRAASILIVSSLTAESPFPFQAAYSASKSFLSHWALALSEELRGSCVQIGVFAPGGIATEMFETSGLASHFKADHIGIQDAKSCATAAIATLTSGDRYRVPGPLNRLSSLFFKFAPRQLSLSQTAALYRGGVK